VRANSIATINGLMRAESITAEPEVS